MTATSKPHAVKAGPIHLSRDARWRDVAAAVLGSVCTHFSDNLQGARAGRPEAIHQLRVAIRRLRVALWVFRDVLPPHTRDALRLDLRWLARKLGPLREVQVYAEEVVAPLLALHARSRALLSLREATNREVKRALREARAAMRAPRGRRTIARVGALPEALNDEALRPARRRAAKRLRRCLEAVFERARASRGRDVTALHDLRKSLKRLRYTADFVGALFATDAVHAFDATMVKLQRVLGALQDAAVARRWHETIVGRRRVNGAARATAMVETALRARSSQATRTLDRALAGLTATTPFWRKGAE